MSAMPKPKPQGKILKMICLYPTRFLLPRCEKGSSNQQPACCKGQIVKAQVTTEPRKPKDSPIMKSICFKILLAASVLAKNHKTHSTYSLLLAEACLQSCSLVHSDFSPLLSQVSVSSLDLAAASSSMSTTFAFFEPESPT